MTQMAPPQSFRLSDHAAVIVLLAVMLVAIAAAVVWLWPSEPSSQRERVIQEISLAPPPPPPPPPPEPEPEPEEVVEEVEPVEMPVETPVPDAAETPSDAPSEPSMEAAGLNQLADAGSDSFMLSSGKGGGLFGRGGGGGGGWEGAVALHITRALQRDPRTSTAGGSVKVVVEIDPRGRFVSARLLSSTGDKDLDRDIAAVLAELAPMSRGRPPGVSGTTNLTINLKRADG